MITTYRYQNLSWIDLESPTKEEVRKVMELYDIHPLIANELLSPTDRQKADFYGHYIYLVLHFPSIAHRHGNDTVQEIDFIIGRDFILTTHYDLIDPLHEFGKLFEVNSILDKSDLGKHAGFVFFHLMRELYRNLSDELDHLRKGIRKIEAGIFGGSEASMVAEISKHNKNLLAFRQSLRSHREILDSFEIASEKLFGPDFRYYARTLGGEYNKVAHILDGIRDALSDLRDTNDSLLTTKTNTIMKMFTAVAFLILPSSLIATLFAMDLPDAPKPEFWFVVSGMIFSMVALFSLFKFKKWI